MEVGSSEGTLLLHHRQLRVAAHDHWRSDGDEGDYDRMTSEAVRDRRADVPGWAKHIGSDESAALDPRNGYYGSDDLGGLEHRRRHSQRGRSRREMYFSGREGLAYRVGEARPCMEEGYRLGDALVVSRRRKKGEVVGGHSLTVEEEIRIGAVAGSQGLERAWMVWLAPSAAVSRRGNGVRPYGHHHSSRKGHQWHNLRRDDRRGLAASGDGLAP